MPLGLDYPRRTVLNDGEVDLLAVRPGNGEHVSKGAPFQLAAPGKAMSVAERSNALGLAFQRLDAMLARALPQARERFGTGAPADSFRGLYISAAQASARSTARPAFRC